MDKFTENVNSQVNEFIKRNDNFELDYVSIEGYYVIGHNWYFMPTNGHFIFDAYDAKLIIDLSKRLGVFFWITVHNDKVAFELSHIEKKEG